MPDSASQILWQAMGRPAPEGKTGATYRFEPCGGRCATCAIPIDAGVPFEPRRGAAGINNKTFYGHAEYARWGTHVCAACAWLYGDPKRTHRGVLGVGGRGWWPTISKPVDGRPLWRDVLADVGAERSALSPETPMSGVLTTDTKPRLWPRAEAATIGSPGLYVHAPDYNWSQATRFDWSGIRAALAAVDAARAAGATKHAIWHGLLLWPALVDKAGLGLVIDLETRLVPWRGMPEGLIATVIA